MFDEVTTGHSVGSSTGQQTWEVLAVLVLLRAWRPRRVTSSVSFDSVGSLHLLLRLQTLGRGLGIVARAFALDMTDALCLPDVVTHTLGIMINVPDILSRWSSQKVTPRSPSVSTAFLKRAYRHVIPVSFVWAIFHLRMETKMVLNEFVPTKHRSQCKMDGWELCWCC